MIWSQLGSASGSNLDFSSLTSTSLTSYAPFAGAALGFMSNMFAEQAKLETVKANINNQLKSFKSEANIVEEQRAQASRELGDIMSSNGLQGVQAEAKVRAMNAERGVSGASVDASSMNVAMKVNLANADAIAQYRNTDIALLNRKLSALYKTNTYIETQGNSSGSAIGGIMNSITSGIGGFATGTMLMSPQQKTDLYKNLFGGF